LLTSSMDMPKIRIVDPKTNFRLNLPVPYKFFVHTFVRGGLIRAGMRAHVRAMEKELSGMALGNAERVALVKDVAQAKGTLAIVEAIDFRGLRMALSDVDGYKGLILVDILTSDGTTVYIEL